MPKLLLINPSPRGYGLAHLGAKAQPLNLAYLAALTPQNWEIYIHDENIEKAVVNESVDLIGITALTSTAPRAYELAEQYRQKNIPVVLGGIHVSMLPDEAEKYADTIVIGEAESVWKQLLNDLLNNKLKKRYNGKRLEFKKAIFPNRDLLSEEYNLASIQTSRGCPFKCEFCSVKAFNGAAFRQRDVDDVLNEIGTIKNKILAFIDDNLIGYSKSSYDRAKKLFKGMIKRKFNKKWMCQTSINFADDEELMKLASKSGCIMIVVGFESIQESVLDGNMNKRLNCKKGAKYYYDFIKKVHKYKITIYGTMMFGCDEENKNTFIETTIFLNKSGLDIPFPGIMSPYPGTKLYDRMKKENRLLFTNYPDDWEKYNMQLIIKLKQYDIEEFIKSFNSFIMNNFSFWKRIKRTLNTLLYSRSLLHSLSVYNFNRVVSDRFKKNIISIPDKLT